MRVEGRGNEELRPVKITNNYLMNPHGSVLIEMGNTKVICTAMVEDKTARHLEGTGKGWVTAEYNMLPGSTQKRKARSIGKGKVDGRSVEIQRLIGRSLRSVVNLEKLGERTIWIDCDVIQADGGTRTASVTGAFIAMIEAMKWMKDRGLIDVMPVSAMVSAVSVGIVEGEAMVDLCYDEDSRAKVDMNMIMTDQGDYVEIQGTGEEAPFSAKEFAKLLAIGGRACQSLNKIQKDVIGEI